MPGNELTLGANEPSTSSNVWKRDALFILGAGVAAFTIGLPGEFIGPDARFALFAKEMLRNRPSFFPTAFSAPYPDYPAATILPIVWLSKICGAVTPLTAIIPTAVVSSGILVVTYLIGAVRSRAWGLCAVFMCILTPEFLRAARGVSPDQWISFATITCFYLANSAYDFGRPGRLWIIPILLVLGFACRGPIGLIIPASAVLTQCLCTRRCRAVSLWALVAVLLLIMCCWALLTAAEYQNGRDFAQRVWEMQVVGRFTCGGRGVWYYWVTALASYAFAFPIAVLVTAALWRRISSRSDSDARLLFALAMCVMVVLGGMSIPAAKKTRYVISIVPFAALLAAYGLMQTDVRGAMTRIRRVVAVGCRALPWIVGAACGSRALLVKLAVIPGDVHLVRAGICTVLAAVLAFSVSPRQSYLPARDLWGVAVGAVSLLILHVGVIEPSIWAREGSLVFVDMVRAHCSLPVKPLVFYRLGPDEEDVVMAANAGVQFRPRFVESTGSLLELEAQTCVIANEAVGATLTSDLPSRVELLGRGTLGGTHCALLSIGDRTP